MVRLIEGCQDLSTKREQEGPRQLPSRVSLPKAHPVVEGENLLELVVDFKPSLSPKASLSGHSETGTHNSLLLVCPLTPSSFTTASQNKQYERTFLKAGIVT